MGDQCPLPVVRTGWPALVLWRASTPSLFQSAVVRTGWPAGGSGGRGQADGVSIRRRADRLASPVAGLHARSGGVSIRRRADRLASPIWRSPPSRSSFNPPSCGQAGQPQNRVVEVTVTFQSAVVRTGWPALKWRKPSVTSSFNPPSCGQAGQPHRLLGGGPARVSIRRRADRLASRNGKLTSSRMIKFQSAVVRTGWPAEKEFVHLVKPGFNPPSCGQAGQPRPVASAIRSQRFNPPSCGQAGQPERPAGSTRNLCFNPPSCGQAGQPHPL